LPERQRQALVLHRFQGMRYQEVAAAMGTTLPGVESLIQRALAGLRADLAGKGDLI
jgi:DNA-directed RNA polymerase specialized sigma24 family protein